MNRTTRTRNLLRFLLTSVLVATPYVVAQEGPVVGGTLVVALSGEPPALDVLSNSLYATRITSQICENLVAEARLEPDAPFMSPTPGLAESWEISDDGLVYTFNLRRGIEFTDGTTFDAQAVLANFDRYLDTDSVFAARPEARGVIASRVNNIESYRATDSHTFEIRLKEPSGSFLNSLRHRNFGVISPTSLELWSQSMDGDHLHCTGPFKYAGRDLGVSVTLERNTGYWNDDGNGPYLDRIIFAIVPDSSSRIAALIQGEVDVDLEVAAGRERELIANPAVEVVMPSNAHIAFWMFNHRSPQMQDTLLRQAIWHALDTERLVESVFSDRAIPMSSILPPGNPGYREHYSRPYPYDAERAMELLEEGGYADGVDITIAYPNTGGSYMDPAAIAQWAQGNLRAVGINATLEVFELSAFQAYLANGLDDRVQIAIQGWQSIADDPLMIDQLLGTDYFVPSGWNRGWYSNPEVDAILERARGVTDEEERVELYQQAEDLILDEAGVIPIAHDRQPRAHRSVVQGVEFGPSPWFDLRPVWIGQ